MAWIWSAENGPVKSLLERIGVADRLVDADRLFWPLVLLAAAQIAHRFAIKRRDLLQSYPQSAGLDSRP